MKKTPHYIMPPRHFLLPALMAILFQTRAMFGQEPAGKVLGTSQEGNTLQLVIESSSRLIPGTQVYLEEGEPILVGDLLSKKGNSYYYSASTSKDAPTKAQDKIYLDPPNRRSQIIQRVLPIRDASPDDPKSVGEVLSVQRGRILINRGSMHQVHELDIYAIYDTSGNYKGKAEIEGIGDLQASGAMYKSLGDVFRSLPSVQPGDKTVLLGQRKLISWGYLFSTKLAPEKVAIEGVERKGLSVGFTAAMLITWRDGWGVDLNLGTLLTDVDNSIGPQFVVGDISRIARTASTFGPIYFRKKFRYPSNISPVVGIGAAFPLLYQTVGTVMKDPLGNVVGTRETVQKKLSLAPSGMIGITFFTGHRFHGLLELHRILTPSFETDGVVWEPKSTWFSLGFSYSF